MAMTPLSALIQAIDAAKAKLYAKAFSTQGSLSTMLHWSGSLPQITPDFNWTILQAQLYELIMSLTLGATVTIDSYTWEQLQSLLPSIANQFSQLAPLTLGTSPGNLLLPGIAPWAPSGCGQGATSKAVYGASCYDYAYVDPTMTIDAIKTMLKRNVSRRTLKQIVDQVLTGVGYIDTFAKWLKYWAYEIETVLSTQFLLGWNLLGYSPLRNQPHVPLSYNPWLSTDGGSTDVASLPQIPASTTDQPLYGLILSLTPLGMGILMPQYQSPVALDWRLFPAATAQAQLMLYTPISTLDKLSEPAPPLAPTQPQTPEYLRSKRADKWGAGMARVQMARAVAKQIAAPYGIAGPALALYMDAAVELVMWCYGSEQRRAMKFNKRIYQDLYKNGGMQAIYSYWSSKYQGLGAAPEILQEIWNALSDACP